MKKTTLLQLAKWETDRATLEALAERAGAEAAVAAKVHATEQADLMAHAEQLEEKMRQVEVDSKRQVEAAEIAAEKRCVSGEWIMLTPIFHLLRTILPQGASQTPSSRVSCITQHRSYAEPGVFNINIISGL